MAALAIEELGIPLLLGTSEGIDTLSTYLYRGWTSGRAAVGAISAGGSILLAITVLLVLVRGGLVRNPARFTTVTGKPKAKQELDLGRTRWLWTLLVVGYLVVTVGVPLVGLVLSAFTPVLTPLIPPWEVLTTRNFARVLDSPILVRSIRNSVLIAVVGACIAVVVSVLASLAAHRSQFKGRGLVAPTLMFPRAVPGLVLGLGFFWVFVSVGPLEPLRLTIWAIVIAFAVRQIPLSYGAIYPALTGMSKELDQAARTTGASWWTTCKRIVVPNLRAAMISGWILAFVAMLNDYDPAVFLVTPGTEVMGLVMLQQWFTGFAGPIAALGCIQLAITVLVLGLGRLIPGVRINA